ncbi:MAG: ribonuclease R [Rhodospirillaceae bacterium]|nr:ribonuclease R [Rhodospirillaceae bacterium]
MADRKKSGALPTEEALFELIEKSNRPLGRRELARHFKLATSDRRALGAMLETLAGAGKIQRGRNRRYMANDRLPSVSVLEVKGIDEDGDPVLRPVDRKFANSSIRIHLNMRDLKGPAPGIGDRVLARLETIRDGYKARVIKRLEKRRSNVIGIFRRQPDSGIVEPGDRHFKSNLLINSRDTAGAEDGDVVECELLTGREHGLPLARVIKSFGRSTVPSAIIHAIIAQHDIPTGFPKDALRQAEESGPIALEDRLDLRDIPLVTVDDETARDFDDAVWAERNEKDDGWHIIVAIADVSAYVRPEDDLDKSARERGNSVYFPNAVVPMLPEALSNGWCSLVPDEDRACLSVEILINDRGEKLSHKFHRSMMRSAARLSYNQLQAIRDETYNKELPIEPDLVGALYGAFDTLERARINRGVLDLDLPERKISVSDQGQISGIEKRVRLDSHRLIEEFMILANVCAAETLESMNMPCMYRIHDEPAADRLVALRKYLKTLGLNLAGGQAVRPRHFASLLRKAQNRPDSLGIQDAILRCQAQARYSLDNTGHFGLALRRYAHFTSPIRRYSDLLVHRALIGALKLGDDGINREAADNFPELADHISMTERRAMSAERNAFDRLATTFLANQEGALFSARITGVERFGLFVEFVETGASALVPVSSLGDGYYRFDSNRRGLFLDGSTKGFYLGQSMMVRLLEANLATGGLLAEPVAQNTENGSKNRSGRGRKKSVKMKIKRKRRR